MEPPLPPDLICVRCSKPIQSSGYLVSPSGEASHIRCRSRDLQQTALEEHDRARRAIDRAAGLVGETMRRRQGSPSIPPALTRQPCPLCGEPATLIDWRPALDWMTVDECPCNGYFVWMPLISDGRLARLTPEDRDTLSGRIRALRLTGEAWLTTRDGTAMGALILRDERPDRPN